MRLLLLALLALACAKEPAAKEPAAKEPAAKEPAAKEPAAKEPVAIPEPPPASAAPAPAPAPSSAPKSAALVNCKTDADCRAFSDYCTGCHCRALSVTQADPVCDGPGVRCFADPCMNVHVGCDKGRCAAGDFAHQSK